MSSYTNLKLLYGTSYQNELDFTRYVTAIDGGLPESGLKSFKKMSDGGILSRTNFFTGREINFDVQFLGWDLVLRDPLLKISALPYYIPKKLVRTQIINGVTIIDELPGQIKLKSGEKFGPGYVKSDVSLSFMSENSFFVRAEKTQHIKNFTADDSVIINNEGYKVFGYYIFEIHEDGSQLELKLSEGYGFKIQAALFYGDIVEVDTSKSAIDIYINGSLRVNIKSVNSAPFELLPGNNEFFYRGPRAAMTLEYYETRL